jgi:hypothetical protein
MGLIYLNKIVAAYFLMYFGKWSFGIGTIGNCCTLLLIAGYSVALVEYERL